MPFLKENPIFSAILGLCALIFVGGVVLVVMAWMDAGEAEERLENARSQVNSARVAEVAPTPENVESAQANIAELKADETRLFETIAAQGALDEAPDNLRGAVLVGSLTRLPVRMRQLARDTAPERVEIGFPDDFQFGFDRYIGTSWPPSGIQSGSPEERELIENLFLQQQVVEYLCRTLFESTPDSWPGDDVDFDPNNFEAFPLQLTSLRRESAIPNTGTGGRRSNRDQRGLFEIEPAISAETDRIGTVGFQIEFESYSRTLRDFLIELGTYQLPLVVRSVEVEPASGGNRGRTADIDFSEDFLESDSDDDVEEVFEPVVETNTSVFRVTVEYIELKEPLTDNSEIVEVAANP